MIEKLPSTGALANREPYGCDTSGMVIVHRMIRYLFTDAPRLVRGVRAGDTKRAHIVGAHVTEIARGLHNHHTAEDDLLWDLLETRARACALHVEQMRTQHAAVGALLTELDRPLAGWMRTADPADAETVAGILDAIRAALFTHLGDEEYLILPTAATVMTQREWDALGERGRASVPKSRLMTELGFIVQPFTPEDRKVWMRTNLPGFVRALYHLFGRRQFVKHYRAIYGVAPE